MPLAVTVDVDDHILAYHNFPWKELNPLLLAGAALLTAIFFSANIGASGTAATMSAAYGGGALRNPKHAVILVAFFSFLGANLGGRQVVNTMSGGIVPSDLLTLEMTLIILLSACLTLFYANKNGIPLSTSEVTVGSIVGVGIALHQVNWMMLLVIVSAWLLMPCCSFLIAYGIGKWLKGREKKWISYMRPWHLRSLSLLLVTSGCYEAFSAGMNNIGNSIGPLVGAGLIAAPAGILIGSISLALGAVWMGRGVLETAAKKITNLSLFKGSAVSMTSGTIVIAASLWGIPVPLTQITIMAIYGISCPALNRGLFRHRTVVKMVKIWLFSPIASMLLSLTLVQVFVLHSFYYILLLFVLFFLALLLVFYSKHKNPTRS